MNFKEWLENFGGMLPLPDWSPSSRQRVMDDVDTSGVRTKNNWVFTPYCLMEYQPSYLGTFGERESKLLHVFPICELDTTPDDNKIFFNVNDKLDRQQEVDYAWKMFNSKLNVYHLLDDRTKSVIDSKCKDKAQTWLHDHPPDKEYHIFDPRNDDN
jgi:hypothetical protein